MEGGQIAVDRTLALQARWLLIRNGSRERVGVCCFTLGNNVMPEKTGRSEDAKPPRDYIIT